MVAMLLPLAAMACQQGAAPAAPASERRFAPGTFTAVALDGPDHVRIVFGKAQSVVAHGDPASLARLSLAVSGTTLWITRSGLHLTPTPPAELVIETPVLHAALLSGSGSITADDVQAERFRAINSGDGALVVTGLGAGALVAGQSSGGTVRITGAVRDVSIEAGRDRIDLTGLKVVPWPAS